VKIKADLFLQALCDAGIIQREDAVRRVVIDATIGHAIVVYVECFGDDRLLNVATTLDGVEIKGVPAE